MIGEAVAVVAAWFAYLPMQASIDVNDVPEWLPWAALAAVVLLVFALLKKLMKLALFAGLVAVVAGGYYLYENGGLG